MSEAYIADLVQGMRMLRANNEDWHRDKSPGVSFVANRKVMSPRAMVEETVALTQQACTVHEGVQLKYSVSGSIASKVDLDLCVQRMLMNLLTNACKHTRQGIIQVSVQLACSASQNFVPASTLPLLEFEVSDTGCGVEEKEEIFAPFVSHSGGIGLGLFLVKSQSEAMGGMCGVLDKAGGGSVFYFRGARVHCHLELLM